MITMDFFYGTFEINQTWFNFNWNLIELMVCVCVLLAFTSHRLPGKFYKWSTLFICLVLDFNRLIWQASGIAIFHSIFVHVFAVVATPATHTQPYKTMYWQKVWLEESENAHQTGFSRLHVEDGKWKKQQQHLQWVGL